MKFLVLGASGFIGKAVAESLKGDYDVVGACATDGANGLMKADVRDAKALDALIGAVKPDAVLDMAGLPNVDYCQGHDGESYEINVTGTRNVAKACSRHGCTLTYVSTDYIFDGKGGPYGEEDEPNPINVYGLHKLMAEKAVAEEVGEYTIVRTTVVYGWEGRIKNFAARTVDNLRAGRQMNVPKDQWGNPTYVDNLAEAVKELAALKKRGIYNVVGSTYCPRYEFARKIAEVFELDINLIKPTDTPSHKQNAPRPLKGGLRIDKVSKELKTRLMGMDEGLKAMRGCEERMQTWPKREMRVENALGDKPK